MVDLGLTEKWIHWLWTKGDGKKATVLCGDGWGDNGKRAVESAIEEFFIAFVRSSGGCNTGGERWIMGKDGKLHKATFHQLPSCWPHKTGVIGHWVLLNLKLLTEEIGEVVDIVGEAKADLFISKEAPLWLPYYSLLEAYSEALRGAGAVGTTKRGIAHTISAIDLREGPVVGYLQHPQLLRKWIRNVFEQHKESLRAYEALCKGTDAEFDLDAEFNPDRVTEELLEQAKPLQQYITDIGPILMDWASKNAPVLYGLTQGAGLSRFATYPFNSSGQITAPSAAFCNAIPMNTFGPVIMVSKLIPTRVGAGPFPTGWWHRDAAMQFPIDNPQLFSVLDEHDEAARELYIKARRALINSGGYTDLDLALLMQVLLNNLGATTKRGREPGAPDLHMTACAAMWNGATTIALTQVDVLEGLKMKFPLGTTYMFDGQVIQPPVFPRPTELMEDPRFTCLYEYLDVDLVGQTLYGTSEPHPIFDKIRGIYKEHTGVDVGLISTSPKGTEGKLFYDQPA